MCRAPAAGEGQYARPGKKSGPGSRVQVRWFCFRRVPTLALNEALVDNFFFAVQAHKLASLELAKGIVQIGNYNN